MGLKDIVPSRGPPTARRRHLAVGVLVFETLTKRRSGIFSVALAPCPAHTLGVVHGISESGSIRILWSINAAKV